MSILDKVLTVLANRQVKKAVSFEDICRQIADGVEPKADRIEEILEGTGKTLEDLRSRVELILRRRVLARLVDDGISANRERAAIEHQVALAKAELDEAHRRHKEKLAPIQDQLRQISNRESEGRQAAEELRRTALDSDKAEVGHHRERLVELDQVIQEIRRKRRDAEGKLQDLEHSRRAGGLNTPVNIDEALSQTRTRLDRYTSELQRVEADRSRVLASLVDAEKRLLVVE